MRIQYLKAEEIDKTKWNSCVHYANNGNVFGYMWYLNNVAKNWDALVESENEREYGSVLPLIWQPKLLKNQSNIHSPAPPFNWYLFHYCFITKTGQCFSKRLPI